MFETSNCIFKYLCVLLGIFCGIGVLSRNSVNQGIPRLEISWRFCIVFTRALSWFIRIATCQLTSCSLRLIKIKYSIIFVYRSESCTKYTLCQNISEQARERTCKITLWHVHIRNIVATVP